MKLHGHMDDAIVFLVRETLGCQCPDGVFKNISHYGCMDPLNGLNINIGKRLALLVTPILSQADNDYRQGKVNRAANLLKSGREVILSKGFNRFRLVLVAMAGQAELNDVKAIANEAYKKFEEVNGTNDKVHIHAISIDDLKGGLQKVIRKFSRMRY